MFNLKKAEIYQAVKWEKFPLFSFSEFFSGLFVGLFLVSFVLFLYGFVPQNFSQETSRFLLGLSCIFFSLAVSAKIKGVFFNSKMKNPELKVPIAEALRNPDRFNLAELLSFEVASSVNKALSFPSKNVSSLHLLYFILKDNSKLNFIFYRLLLDPKDLKKSLRKEMDSEDKENFQEVILESLKVAEAKNHQRIQIGDMLSALAKIDVSFRRVLLKANIKKEDIDNLVSWMEAMKEKDRFWDCENLAKRGTLAKTWTAGYTTTLDKYSRDLTDILRGKDLEFFGHQSGIEAMERVLSRREINNVLLVGQPGSGRKSMIYHLAQKSFFGKSLPEVSYKRVVELDLSSLISQIENPEEVESVLDKIFHEVVSAGNIILVIDQFHNYIGQEAKPGVVDISGIIGPYLHLPQFQIIALSDFEGFHRNIAKNSTVLALFEKVEVAELSPEDTLSLLERMCPVLEGKYKIFVSYPALKKIISLAERYFASLPFPEKAIDILDEVSVLVNSEKRKIVLPKDVAKIVTEKTEVPVGELETKERRVLLDLEEIIHRRIINQKEAVKEISTALRRARSEITVRKGLMGGFLFLGPTGVGKTETSKALAEAYFGSEERMIRLDMSEFQNPGDISRLIGSKDRDGVLTTAVKEDPFSLILLDEIEKSHPSILNLFLQVLDEGHLTDSMGRKVDFRSCIIIATSNAGYQVILEALEKEEKWESVKKDLLDHLFEKRVFRPEFINRFDAVVVFGPLSKQNLLDISELIMLKLKKNLAEKGIDLEITEPLKKKIVDLGYDPRFGAREMRRVIQNKIENVLASALLSGEISRGDKVKINSSNFKLKVSSQKEL